MHSPRQSCYPSCRRLGSPWVVPSGASSPVLPRQTQNSSWRFQPRLCALAPRGVRGRLLAALWLDARGEAQRLPGALGELGGQRGQNGPVTSRPWTIPDAPCPAGSRCLQRHRALPQRAADPRPGAGAHVHAMGPVNRPRPGLHPRARCPELLCHGP